MSSPAGLQEAALRPQRQPFCWCARNATLRRGCNPAGAAPPTSSSRPPSLPQIDRSPKHFHRILDFLRNGRVALPSSSTKLEELLVEAEFFKLDELAGHVKQALQGLRTVRMKGMGGPQAGLGGR